MNAKGSRLQHWSDVVKYPGQAHTKTHFLSANYIDWRKASQIPLQQLPSCYCISSLTTHPLQLPSEVIHSRDEAAKAVEDVTVMAFLVRLSSCPPLANATKTSDNDIVLHIILLLHTTSCAKFMLFLTSHFRCAPKADWHLWLVMTVSHRLFEVILISIFYNVNQSVS